MPSMSPPPAALESDWKTSHLPSGDQCGLYTLSFWRNWRAGGELPSARLVHNPNPAGGATEAYVNILPSGVQEGLTSYPPSDASFTLGPPSSCLIQMLMNSLATLRDVASHSPFGEIAGKPR